MGLPMKPLAALALVREFKAISAERPTLVLAGTNDELVGVLRRELLRGEGADPSAIAAASGPDAVVLVWVQAGPFTEAHEAQLRATNHAGLPIIAVVVGGSHDERLPYVLPTDHIFVGPGEPFPVGAIARALGHRVGSKASGLAARLPVLREGICEELVKSGAKSNAMLATVIPVPGADLPVLALTQVRLVLRIAHAHGEPVDTKRLPEILGVVLGAVGLRQLFRQLAGTFLPGLLVSGVLAYGGTRAIGEAAIRYFERRDPTP